MKHKWKTKEGIYQTVFGRQDIVYLKECEHIWECKNEQMHMN